MKNPKPYGLMCKSIVGIDPGGNGGIAIQAKGETRVVKMPKTIVEFSEIIKEVPEPFVFIERVNKWRGDIDTPGKHFGIDKMVANYNMVLNGLQILGVPYLEVHPRKWQSEFKTFLKDKTDRKQFYVQRAKALYPDLKVFKWNADALLILYCGRVWTQWGYDWIYKTCTPFTKDKARWLWKTSVFM